MKVRRLIREMGRLGQLSPHGGRVLTILFIILSVTSFVASRVDGAEPFAGPQACAECHADEYAAWKGSVHARALSDKFTTIWKSGGEKPLCLECHTTGHDNGRRTYQHAGVTCESCHGKKAEGHPGDAKMPIPMSSQMCQSCHRKTFQEWQLSRHGQKGIRCFDCHNVHAQGLRAGGGDALCGSCHPGRLKDFAHATHHLKGLKCATCHYPRYPGSENAIEGTGAGGHSMFVGAEVCARCHEEMVHKSHKIPTLTGQVDALSAQTSLSLIGVLKAQIQQFETKLQIARGRAYKYGLVILALGIAVGVWAAAKKGPPSSGLR